MTNRKLMKKKTREVLLRFVEKAELLSETVTGTVYLAESISS